MFSSTDYPINTFKSKELALFPVFDIGRIDAAALLSAIEKADPGLHRHVEIRNFAYMYAGDHVPTFMLLWDLYWKLVDPTPPKSEVIVKKKKRIKNVLIYDDDDDLEVEDPTGNDSRPGSRPATADDPTASALSTTGKRTIELPAIVLPPQTTAAGSIVGTGTESNEANSLLSPSSSQQQQQTTRSVATDVTPGREQMPTDNTQGLMNLLGGLLSPREKVMSDDGSSVFSGGQPEKARVEYDHVMFFLLFFMHIADEDLPLFIFWLTYTSQKIEPTPVSIIELIDQLWGKPRGKLLKTMGKLKSLAEKATKNIYASEIVPNKLRFFDASCGGPWTRPVRLLRKQLRKNIMGNSFWQRVAILVTESMLDLDEHYLRLEDTFPLSKWGRHDFDIIGDRRAARKDVRLFVRLYKSYVNMPLEEVHASYGHVRTEEEFDEMNGLANNNNSSSSNGTAAALKNKMSEIGVKAVEVMLQVAAAPINMIRGPELPPAPLTIADRMRQYQQLMSERSGRRGSTKSFKSGKSAYDAPTGSRKSPKSGKTDSVGDGAEDNRSSRTMEDGEPANTSEVVGSNVSCLPGLHTAFVSRQKTADEDEPVVSLAEQQRKLVPLEVVYKDSLTVPLPQLYNSVHSAQDRARAMLDAARNELTYSAYDEKMKREARIAAQYMASLSSAHERRRQVVIDVSSSEDSSDYDGRDDGRGNRGSSSRRRQARGNSERDNGDYGSGSGSDSGSSFSSYSGSGSGSNSGSENGNGNRSGHENSFNSETAAAAVEQPPSNKSSQRRSSNRMRPVSEEGVDGATASEREDSDSRRRSQKVFARKG